MKTDAPGKFSCEIYVKAWELGFREGSTRLHIDNCSFCNPIVHGGTEEFPLPAAEQARRNIADRKLASRRRFFRQAGVAAGFVGLSALGLNFFKTSESISAPNSADAEVAADFTQFDSRFAVHGRAGIQATLNNAPVRAKVRVLEWIEIRGHSSLFDLVCQSLKHGNPDVATVALLILTKRINPVDLKPHVTLIQTSIPVLKDEFDKELVEKLLEDIESA